MNKLITNISGINKLTKEAFEYLSEVSDINYVTISGQYELQKSLSECDVFWFRLNHKLTDEVLKTAKCKFILCAVTGLDHIDLEACKKNNITVISLKNEQEFLKEVRATVEHSFGLMLSLIRQNKVAFKHSEEYKWNRNLFQGEELYRKNIGILGFGRLGKIMADYAAAFGMKVFYFDKIEDRNTSFTRCNSINELISKVDFLSIHITFDSSTHFIVNENVLKSIQQKLYIINTSRGGVVNEDDIIKYLKLGKIKGYATDVLYKEPDIQENNLIAYAKEHTNVIITPHIGGFTKESIAKTEIFIARKFIKIFKKNKF